jgi:hypothetical protein
MYISLVEKMALKTMEYIGVRTVIFKWHVTCFQQEVCRNFYGCCPSLYSPPAHQRDSYPQSWCRFPATSWRKYEKPMKSPVFQRLPTSIFDFALLSRRQYWSEVPDKISPRRVQSPSFSWAGWRGETFWDLEDVSGSYEKRFNDWLNQRTWITTNSIQIIILQRFCQYQSNRISRNY